MTCSEPLVWTCHACGHSFHADEWQFHGHLCPACNSRVGSWRCGKCQVVFNQPFLGSEHPCLAQSTQGQSVRLVSKSQSLPPSYSKAKVSPPPLLAGVPTGHPNSSKSIYGWPVFVILLIGAGLGLLFSGFLVRKGAEHLPAKDHSSAPPPSLNSKGSGQISMEPKSRDSAYVEDRPFTTNHQEVQMNEATDPAAAVAASRLPPAPAPVKPTLPPPRPLPSSQDISKLIPNTPSSTQKSISGTPSISETEHTNDLSVPIPTAAQAAADASDSSSAMAPPPDIFRDRAGPEKEAGIPFNQNAFFAPEGTAFGRYQRKLYLAIGSRWNLKVHQTMAKLGVERVIVNFQVMPDGTISDLRISQGDPNSILAILSKDAIEQSGGLIGPFPDDLLKEKPNGFPWQLAFRIY